jgi:2-aminobenzoate-CoA ligase
MMPPEELWPEFDYSREPLCRYPDLMNVVDILLDRAITEGFGGKPAIHFEDGTWTYAQLQDRVDRIARVLVEDYGLVPGNRVLMRSGNNPMLAACWLAVLKAGGICITTMPLLKTEELEFIVDRVEVGLALCEHSLADEMAAVDSVQRISYFSPSGGSLSAELDVAIEKKTPGFSPVATAADDIAVIAFTSGTTGRPKAAVHAHRDVIAISDCYPRVHKIDRDEIIGGSPSMAFAYGLGTLLVYPLRYRATVVYVPRPTAEYVLGAVERHRITSLYCVPTSYRQMLDEIHRFDVGSLRKCASSGENLQTPLWEAWRDRTGIRLVNNFGATELICSVLSDSLAVDRVGSSGRAVPGYSARLVDTEGNPLPFNARGRIAIRGPTGCRYLDDIEQQRSVVQHGWNVMSDVFVQDVDGYFWFVDRADDMIVSSGYNISPQEVERALMEHPLVSECAIVGVDNASRGKLVRACVVLTNPKLTTQKTAQDLQNFVKHRIAPYKYPREVLFFDELPKTHTGKIQRARLREG